MRFAWPCRVEMSISAQLMKSLKPLRRPHQPAVLSDTECCDVMHVFDSEASSWLPGCAHLGAV